MSQPVPPGPSASEPKGPRQSPPEASSGDHAVATPTTWRDRLRPWARALKRDAIALFLALRDPRTPWTARLIGFLTCAYAFSPIDLIPDFIPVVGQLDDLLLVPLGILLARRCIPDPLWAEFRAQATTLQDRPMFPGGWVVVVATWIVALGLLAWVMAAFLR
ncbi:MAG: hypothetical protein OZSIB_1255 [Candidatus Ozemobacter sibiricus]|jgi:uncharacterized membrane protein YkvA (DUF1232 family)|uniref:DUF1232 domain-containing protein n=1 Tax=Candidatus Ozemobacter sibiricus TaxID=2268124 RepID=A0A367ZKW1_9BACT|nr:MAG: hypothetical protein OZSIB_1255 [Candidatus Ozemobacter sibiricus]